MVLLVAARVLVLFLYLPFGLTPSQWLAMQLNGLLSAEYTSFFYSVKIMLSQSNTSYQQIQRVCNLLLEGYKKWAKRKLVIALDEMNVLSKTHNNQFVRPSLKYGVDVDVEEIKRLVVHERGAHVIPVGNERSYIEPKEPSEYISLSSFRVI